MSSGSHDELPPVEIAPGHLIALETDCEALEFTPTDALEQAMEAVRRNYAAGETFGD